MKRRTIAGSFFDAVGEMVDRVLDGIDRSKPHVLIGPVVWQPDELGGRRWYFSVGSGGAGGFRSDQLAGEDRAFTESIRAAFLLALTAHPPLVIHDFVDELEMAMMAAAIWPSELTCKIRADIRAERAATFH